MNSSRIVERAAIPGWRAWRLRCGHADCRGRRQDGGLWPQHL